MFDVDRPSWSNPKVLSLLALIFVVGALTGALGMRLGLHDRVHAPVTASPGLSSPQTAKAFLSRCQSELNLTPQQAEQMSTILDDYKLYYQNLQEQLNEVRATGKIRIMFLLDDHQKQKFEKILAEWK